ncbi:MAG: hypothetical protein ABMA64_04110 [Myxococcota bacterium]
MKVALTKAEYRAVNALRGLPEGAHMLVSFIGEEIGEGIGALPHDSGVSDPRGSRVEGSTGASVVVDVLGRSV